MNAWLTAAGRQVARRVGWWLLLIFAVWTIVCLVANLAVYGQPSFRAAIESSWLTAWALWCVFREKLTNEALA